MPCARAHARSLEGTLLSRLGKYTRGKRIMGQRHSRCGSDVLLACCRDTDEDTDDEMIAMYRDECSGDYVYSDEGSDEELFFEAMVRLNFNNTFHT